MRHARRVSGAPSRPRRGLPVGTSAPAPSGTTLVPHLLHPLPHPLLGDLPGLRDLGVDLGLGLVARAATAPGEADRPRPHHQDDGPAAQGTRCACEWHENVPRKTRWFIGTTEKMR